ncbi:MAG: hypothetical protein Q9M21_07055, partial [Mariprofundaceae bacterium]|nr:hypothetical protein [Mariprofundaceae bacterium]
MLKYVFILLSLIISNHAFAVESIESVQQQLNTFKQSSDAMYANATLTRAEAYLGAAMLADEEEKQEATQDALRKAQSTIQEAKANAKHFQEQFEDLLDLQNAAQEVMNKL